MAVDKLVDSEKLNANLTSVANAIRGQTNTDEDLSFPDGFVSSINSIDKSLGITEAMVGKIARIAAVDVNGRPTAWEPAETYPKKVFDYTYEGNWHHINVTDIDYENGILMLEPNDALFTDDVSTTIRCCVIPKIADTSAQFRYGKMPPELYSRDCFYGVSVGDNQIKLYKNATTSVDVITDTEVVDFNAFMIFAELSRNRGVNGKTVRDIDFSHRIRAEYWNPYGPFQYVAGITSNASAGNNYGCYIGQDVTLYPQNLSLGSFGSDGYALMSMRGVHYNALTTYQQYGPTLYTAEFVKLSDMSWMIDTKIVYPVWGNSMTKLSASSVPRFLHNEWQIYSKDTPIWISFTTGNNNTIFDGTICRIYDLGEL